ncbi:MAG: TVP38/TMEM64 family protein [Wenzhouxiangellaceae bacterium]|nr:TVP38/TMEM64 family protein [Wenzhouxiangellaceae bacterium]MBS3824218.1 TVP38/TMEM64 family protein [Wenzhouxiangellaceae bacterium]
MRPDRPTLLAWGLTVALVGASAVGAWMLTGENIDGLLALLERLQYRSEFRPFSTAVVFAAIFALTTALTLPTATVLCVAAGYLFGTLNGTLVSMAGALGGAMITFLGVRSIARERVRNFLLRGRTHRLVRLLERDALFYLIVLRIVPVAPFFAINAAGAMIRISLARFLLPTAAGLAPIVLVYASVGAGLDTLIEAGSVGGPEALLRPRILLPLLALIAVLLLGMLARSVFLRRRRRRRQAN